MRLAGAVTVAILATVLVAATDHTARADGPAVQTYHVKKGDTLGLIAAEYYGDRNKVTLLADENKLSLAKPVVLKPGRKLRVPVSRHLVTQAGETFASLAKQFLGDERRADELAQMNDLPLPAGLPAGTPITIPMVVTHVAAGEESFAQLAQTYLGDVRQADLLRTYNFFDKASVESGESIAIPVYTVAVAPIKLPPLDDDSLTRQRHQPEVVRSAAAGLTIARAAWQAGNFDAMLKALSGIETEYLDTATAVEVDVRIGCAYVALGKRHDADALAAFARARARDPEATLDPFLYSPKITAVWARAAPP